MAVWVLVDAHGVIGWRNDAQKRELQDSRDFAHDCGHKGPQIYQASRRLAQACIRGEFERCKVKIHNGLAKLPDEK